MATKPTRLQEQARERLVEALGLVAEAARLDGKGSITPEDWKDLAGRLARASSAFSLDDLALRALERRGKNLGFPTGTIELLTLFDAGITPLEMVRITDDEFRDLVARMEEELGEG